MHVYNAYKHIVQTLVLSLYHSEKVLQGVVKLSTIDKPVALVEAGGTYHACFMPMTHFLEAFSFS